MAGPVERRKGIMGELPNNYWRAAPQVDRPITLATWFKRSVSMTESHKDKILAAEQALNSYNSIRADLAKHLIGCRALVSGQVSVFELQESGALVAHGGQGREELSDEELELVRPVSGAFIMTQVGAELPCLAYFVPLTESVTMTDANTQSD